MTLGIDVGGTNLVLGLVRENQIIKRVSHPWSPRNANLKETIDFISEKISGMITPDTRKIGIGVPSVVDINRGIVYDTANIPAWKEVPLKDILEERFHIPVVLNNDANCYAMGVYGQYPEDEKPEVLVVITLGTGGGIGIVDRGRLFPGTNCGAGELGSLPYGGAILESFCSKQFFNRNEVDSLEVSKAAREGDTKAKALFEEFGHNMGVLLSTVILAYDPSHIVFGGGIANNYDLFREAMMEYLKTDFPYQNSIEKLTIDVCTGNDIPVLGATLI